MSFYIRFFNVLVMSAFINVSAAYEPCGIPNKGPYRNYIGVVGAAFVQLTSIDQDNLSSSDNSPSPVQLVYRHSSDFRDNSHGEFFKLMTASFNCDRWVLELQNDNGKRMRLSGLFNQSCSATQCDEIESSIDIPQPGGGSVTEHLRFLVTWKAWREGLKDVDGKVIDVKPLLRTMAEAFRKRIEGDEKSEWSDIWVKNVSGEKAPAETQESLEKRFLK
jgi:hypothetical protein